MTGPRSWIEPGSAPPRAARGRGTAWLVTFTDLVALMVTFFVLIFAMSQVEQQKWRTLVQSLTGEFTALEEGERAVPSVRPQLAQEAPPPGTDLDYLEPVLREQIAAEPALTQALLWRARGRLVIALPAAQVFAADSAGPTPGARPTALALAGVLRSLRNRLEASAPLAAADEAAAWQLSLARAAALVRLLAEAGLPAPVVARGLGAAPEAGFLEPQGAARRAWAAGRLEIAVLDEGEAP